MENVPEPTFCILFSTLPKGLEMKTKKVFYIISLLALLSTSTLFHCHRDFATNPDNHEEFYLKYTIVGGIQGLNKNLEIFDNHNVTYQDHSFSIIDSIGQKKLDELYNLLMENDYFTLNTQYIPDHAVMDDILTTITFHSPTRSKTVTVSSFYSYKSDGAAWKENFGIICKYLDDYITTLTTDINSGKVTIRSKSILEEWPFSEKINLAENLNNNITADEEVFNYLKEQKHRLINIKFFEGEYIYDVYGNGGYSFEYSELDTFYISIYYQSNGILWPFEMKLSDMTHDGYILNGPDYIWLRDTLETDYSTKLFYDTGMDSGEYVYELSLVHGNYFNP